jgi:DNA repair exonuclease SbcCD ATPase subunit
VFGRLSSLLRSKRGYAAALSGLLILLGLLVYGLVLALRHVEPVADYAGPIVSFLGTGPGVLLAVVGAVLLILWALRARSPESKPDHAARSPASERKREPMKSALQEGGRERERLWSELREGERERERLRSKLREGERERERLRSQLREGKQELERLRSTLQEGRRERERLRSKLREGEREHERLKSELREGRQERERLESALQEGEPERERLKSENERLRAERDTLKEKVTTYDNRMVLKQALDAAYRDSLHLREISTSRRRKTSRGRTPNDEAAAKWAIRTSELIKEGLGEGEARRFLGVDVHRSEASSATEEQKRLDGRLHRLAELIQRVDSLQPLELQPGFKVTNGLADDHRRSLGIKGLHSTSRNRK